MYFAKNEAGEEGSDALAPALWHHSEFRSTNSLKLHKDACVCASLDRYFFFVNQALVRRDAFMPCRIKITAPTRPSPASLLEMCRRRSYTAASQSE